MPHLVDGSRFIRELVGCFGGDEFLVGWRTSKQDDRIAQVARCLIAEIGAPVLYAKKDLRVGASIGIAFINRRKEPPPGRRSSMPISP